MNKSKIQPIDKKPGGSYLVDPETGKRTLVEQTKQRVITRLKNKSESDKPAVKKSTQKKTTGGNKS